MVDLVELIGFGGLRVYFVWVEFSLFMHLLSISLIGCRVLKIILKKKRHGTAFPLSFLEPIIECVTSQVDW